MSSPISQAASRLSIAIVSVAVFQLLACSTAQASIYNDAVLADNPVYYYTLDNGTSGLSNLGSAGGGVNNLSPVTLGPSYGSGGATAGGVSLGDAATFNGTSGARLASGILSGGAFSKYVVEYWFNGTDSTSNQYLYLNGATPNQSASILGYNDGVFEAFSTIGRTNTDGPTGLADGSWHHVVVGIDSAASHLIYIDDTLFPTTATTETLSPWIAAPTPLHLGGSSSTTSGFLFGSLDEFAVYNVGAGDLATFTADIADHYNVSNLAAVPEPSTFALFTLGLLGLLACGRRRRR